MNTTILLAKVNKKADKEHSHSSTEVGVVPMKNSEIDEIVNNALKK